LGGLVHDSPVGRVGTAHAALAIIVHPSNNMAGITADQAADIYLGKSGVFPTDSGHACRSGAEQSRASVVYKRW
jgi:hypothetical protein